MPIHRYETEQAETCWDASVVWEAADPVVEQADTQVGFTESLDYHKRVCEAADQWEEAARAWAAEDPLPVEPEVRTYKLPIVTVVAAAAAVVGALSMVAIHTTTAVAPPQASSEPSVASPVPPPPPPPVTPSTEPPAPSTAPPEPTPPNSATQDSTFINDLNADGMHFPYGTAAAITEGHTVCSRLAGGELRAMVVVDVIAGSVVPGYLPLTIEQARYLVDSAVAVYCSVPASGAIPSVPAGPGHYTIA